MLFSAFVLFSIQACLVQSVFSQCLRSYPASPAMTAVPLSREGALNAIAAPFVASVTSPLTDSFLVPAAVDASIAYGGGGIGEAAVAGELPAAGTTALAGDVPILGGVEFGGIISAAGTVSIAGSCAAGCFTPYI